MNTENANPDLINLIGAAQKVALAALGKLPRRGTGTAFDHAKGVSERVGRFMGLDKEVERVSARAYAVALLHDILEDTKMTASELNANLKNNGAAACDSAYVAKAVMVLTHGDDESYGDYIDRIVSCGDLTPVLVKLCDMLDNLGSKPKKSSRKKYRKHMPTLVRALIELDETSPLPSVEGID